MFIREHRTMSFDVLFTINLFFQNPSGRQKGGKKNQTNQNDTRSRRSGDPAARAGAQPPAHASPRRLEPRGASSARGPRPAPPASLAAPCLPPSCHSGRYHVPGPRRRLLPPQPRRLPHPTLFSSSRLDSDFALKPRSGVLSSVTPSPPGPSSSGLVSLTAQPGP